MDRLVVGIDVGGQTSKLGVVDARGTVLAQTVIRTDTYSDVVPYIAELADAVKKVVKEAGAEGKIRGIGVGAPNGNYYTGQIESALGFPGALPQRRVVWMLFGAFPGAFGLGRAQPQRRGTSPSRKSGGT